MQAHKFIHVTRQTAGATLRDDPKLVLQLPLSGQRHRLHRAKRLGVPLGHRRISWIHEFPDGNSHDAVITLPAYYCGMIERIITAATRASWGCRTGQPVVPPDGPATVPHASPPQPVRCTMTWTLASSGSQAQQRCVSHARVRTVNGIWSA